MKSFRFTLIFAFDPGTETGAARLVAPLADIIAARECEIFGFTVWPSTGWTKPYGIESGATVEFCAPLRRAVEFAAGVAEWYLQDCVYLASGSGAALVDSRGRIIETLAAGEIFTAENVTLFNSLTEVIDNV